MAERSIMSGRKWVVGSWVLAAGMTVSMQSSVRPEENGPKAAESSALVEAREHLSEFTVNPSAKGRDAMIEMLPNPLGAVFVLAHGTNPEVLIQIEAHADEQPPRWRYSLARLGSAEMHVSLDSKEVWTQDRTPGIVGQPVDPYWLLITRMPPRSARASASASMSDLEL